MEVRAKSKPRLAGTAEGEGGPAITARRLWKLYGDQVALRDVTFTLVQGETLAVLGPNGAGKTTLLRVIAGLLRPGGGDIEVLGCKLPADAWRLRGQVGFLGHDPLLYRDLSARENLRFNAALHGLTPDSAEQRIGSLLELVGMSAHAERPVSELSAGMTQRVAICRAVLAEPPLLLLDEPYAHLDSDAASLVQPAIGRQRGVTRILVSHDRDGATAEADRVLELEGGSGTA